MSELPRTRTPRFLEAVRSATPPVAAAFTRLQRPPGASAPPPSPASFPFATVPDAPPPALAQPPEPGRARPTPPPLPTPPPVAMDLAAGFDAYSQLSAAVESLRLKAARLGEQARSDALEIGFQIARRIIDAELKASPEPLFAMVKSAVRRLGDARRVTLRLHPDDATLLESKEVRQRIGLTLMQVEVIADARLGRGDCVIDSEVGSIDGRIDARLDELKRGASATLTSEDEEAP